MINIQNNIAEMSVGNISIGSAYVGSQLVWEKSSPVLPYDAQVEYLEGTGTQYINTGIVNSSAVVIDMKAALAGRNCLSGSEKSSSYRFKWGTSGASVIYYGYGGSSISGSVTPTLTDKYIFHMESKNQYVKDENNNTLISSKTTLSRFSTTPIYLFRCMSGSSLVSMTGTIRIYYCNITKGNTSLQLIPVRKNGVGYLYDKVGGTLFGNAGSGSFTYGNDVT